MNNLSLCIEDVSKKYLLGTFGKATLKAELQSKMARLRHETDPNQKIGREMAAAGNEIFWALRDVSFEVRKGESFGIIGHNGAGKSTLLKLICRITTPTKGNIYINGRITSMLEVGTGFHPELTGRENVFLNGAILGMSRMEIARKFDEIVAFSEVEQFIDTPVKRYSSGMKVKLAFAVASHLDSEILVMDEVLAVGDVNFQNKCLERMKVVCEQEGRTVLYVSHNMSTIKSFCQRCMVMDHGHPAFLGGTEEAIGVYMKNVGGEGQTVFDTTNAWRKPRWNSLKHFLNGVELLDAESNCCLYGSPMAIRLNWQSKENTGRLQVKIVLSSVDSTPVGVAFGGAVPYSIGENSAAFALDTSSLIPGRYLADIILYDDDNSGKTVFHDWCQAFRFTIVESNASTRLKKWYSSWGYTVLPDLAKRGIE